MTPNPPSSSEEPSFPKRSRPSLSDVIKDSSELDLWAFDDVDPVADLVPKADPLPPVSPGIPQPRERRKKVTQQTPEALDPTRGVLTGKKSVRVDVSQEPVKTPDFSTNQQPTPQVDDFDELEESNLSVWEDTEPPALAIHPSLLAAGPAPFEEEEIEDTETPVPPAPRPKPATEETDEFSPVVPENAKPISLVPRLQLSKIEWIGLSVLCAILLAGAVTVFLNSIYRLPAGAERLKAGDFPVKGQHVTIQSADSFWRAPIKEGENAETFRRGTELLPVVVLTSSGNPGAVRVIFRNQDGQGQGDVKTRTITPGVPLQVAATTGFEDVGMHAAYRTGQTGRWAIEVLEAPAETASNAEFKKLFEIDISTDRR